MGLGVIKPSNICFFNVSKQLYYNVNRRHDTNYKCDMDDTNVINIYEVPATEVGNITPE
jgi:hypothetical protein